MVGFFSYDLGYELHQISKTAIDDLQLPDICFFAFDNYLLFKNNIAEIHYEDSGFLQRMDDIAARPLPQFPQSQSVNFRPIWSPQSYERAYHTIKDHIVRGDIYQINLTHRLEARSSLPAKFIFKKVMEKNPVDFLAYIEGDGYEVLSASPERFVKTTKRKIETCPIKGTRPRGRTAASDQRYLDELLANEKEAAELNMITDLLRNDLGKVCRPGSVKVRGSRLVSKCPTVWHTYSRINGTVADQYEPIDALVSMLPGGSITGCPKKRAMEIIDALEPTTRSVYTGAIGVIEPGGNLDFSIAIRTIIKKAERLYLQVGGGIVHDSTEKAEFQETLDKAKSFMRILS
ncbi:MAG: anthranilate synthase component I family protein [bacterium]|nr:anthranilate synthase component I family protein [bacterium]